MKILLIGNFGHGWDGSICDEEHIAQALEELGHEVQRIQRDELDKYYSVEGWEFPGADFTLIAQWDGYFNKTQYMLRALPKPLVYWAFDYQKDDQEWHRWLVHYADLYLSKRIADSRYSNWQWLSQDFAPSFLIPEVGVEKDIDVLFTGSYLDWAEERNKTIEAVREKFSLVIHSVNEWPGGNEGPIMDHALPALYARAKLVLSIDHTLEAGYWSDRNAQAMVCNAFVLFRYIPLSEATFRDKVQYFYSVEDCLEKIEYWLDHPQRDLKAKEGFHYALDNLMVKNRVKDLITIVEAKWKV